jgi:hypothetical protein
VSPVKYELSSYIPEDGILHSHCRESLKSYIVQCSSEISAFLLQAFFTPDEVPNPHLHTLLTPSPVLHALPIILTLSTSK